MNQFSLFCLLALVAGTAFALPTTRSGCSISIQDNLGNPQPLILKDGNATGYEAFHLPTEDEEVHLEDGEIVVVACPGGDVRISGTNTRSEQAEAKCSSGKFRIEGKSVSFSSITCSKTPYHTARLTGESCLDDKQEVEIGFNLEDSNRFIRQITICFDDILLISEYSQFTLSKSISGYESGTSRPNFVEDNFFPFKVNQYYVRNKQRSTINKLLGLSSSSTKYVAASGDYFMSRGHLAAKADFIYGTQQRATFHYVNVAPQWQTFNGRNWNTLEMNIRSYVSDVDSWETRYTLYTGTHGITTLPHEETGEDIELFLHVDGDVKAIPVPQLYWRVLKNEDTNEAVAFVGINNPYHKNVEDEVICESVCDKLSWLHWKGEEIDQGYSYCCTVEDLRKVVKNLPEFDVEGLLV